MKFLETISAFGYDALIPISRIKFIYITLKQSWEIRIYTEARNGEAKNSEWIECFENNEEGMEKLNKRFNMIKKIIEAA